MSCGKTTACFERSLIKQMLCSAGGYPDSVYEPVYQEYQEYQRVPRIMPADGYITGDRQWSRHSPDLDDSWSNGPIDFLPPPNNSGCYSQPYFQPTAMLPGHPAVSSADSTGPAISASALAGYSGTWLLFISATQCHIFSLLFSFFTVLVAYYAAKIVMSTSSKIIS